MSVIEITSREFRNKQKTYLELADKGEKIIIRRGRSQSYLITPVQSEDIIISSEMEQKIEKALQQVESGEIMKIKGLAQLNVYLENL